MTSRNKRDMLDVMDDLEQNQISVTNQHTVLQDNPAPAVQSKMKEYMQSCNQMARVLLLPVDRNLDPIILTVFGRWAFSLVTEAQLLLLLSWLELSGAPELPEL